LTHFRGLAESSLPGIGQSAIPTPRPAPRALAGLDSHRPVLTAGPDTKEVGAVLREPGEYLLGLAQIDVLPFADEGQILAYDEERLALAELEEAMVLPPTRRKPLLSDAAHSKRILLDWAVHSYLEESHSRILTRLHRRKSRLPCPAADRIVPILSGAALIHLPPLIVLAEECGQYQGLALGLFIRTATSTSCGSNGSHIADLSQWTAQASHTYPPFQPMPLWQWAALNRQQDCLPQEPRKACQ